MDKNISYAQNKEDFILAGFFEDNEKGFYVDVGANSPVVDSVTKLFYDKGWSGINIEPIRNHFIQLKNLRPRDINLNIGISNKAGVLNLREYEGSGLSTFSNTLKDQYETSPDYFTEDYKDYEVKVVSLADVFSKHKVKHISFMKIDVEGYEYNVIEGNDWSRYRPEVICIEANHIEQDWHLLLKNHNYKKVFKDGLNEYFVDKQSHRKKEFSYIEAVINKEPIINYRFLPELNRLERSQLRLLSLEKELELKTEQINHLGATLGELTPLRRHFKRQLKIKLKNVNRKIYDSLKSHNKYAPLGIAAATIEAANNADKLNFSRYNQSKKAPPLLRLYIKITNFLIRIASRFLRITKV
ncbi:MAG: FkbM family methyltransferase [Candidatus Microsaccharimonas sossegonensis]|uniref:FkbM family methyltransferase n=1 Tax=Candidatus Microsaccharimonas sossegonensis TaxID=2506948 RepID=A0A4Q0AH73_9BACT|nr:MAG: FkbM family methyltransferase [Candidatus Microsaccharimonas sossegonensis]